MPADHVDADRNGERPSGGDHDPARVLGLRSGEEDAGDDAVAEDDQERRADRLGHLAGGERRADRARAHRATGVLEPRHDVDREAEPGALRGEIAGRAAALRAEMEIEADRNAGHRQPLHQHACDEVLGRELGQRRVEAEHDGAVEPGRRQQPQLRPLVGQPEQRLVRPKDAARVRLEGERRGRPAERLGALQRSRDHRAVAAVHAVEIADGDHRAAQRVVVGRVVAHHRERSDRLPAVGHGGRLCEHASVWRLVNNV